MGYKFTFTKDGSVGLFDEEVNDIYHSSSGAFQEAADKFVIPSQIERFKNSSCNVLDICYGIGYNTKALLNYSIKNNLNINFKIDALELNKELIQISPFLKSKKYLYDFSIDKFILSSFLDSNKLDFEKIKSIINKNKNYLTLYKPDLYKIMQNMGYNYGVFDKINAFLHNIYYHNISYRLKLDEISSNLYKSTLKWHTNDARSSIFHLNTKYDIIFLDAFTPQKQPILWTYEFLDKVVSLLNKDTGVLVSYSIAAPFRKTLIDLGLNVGKFYLNNINSTVASFNNSLIKYELDEFEKGLLNTKAGIPYRDKTLSLSTEEILKNRNDEIITSTLESANKYYKRNGRKYGKH